MTYAFRIYKGLSPKIEVLNILFETKVLSHIQVANNVTLWGGYFRYQTCRFTAPLIDFKPSKPQYYCGSVKLFLTAKKTY